MQNYSFSLIFHTVLFGRKSLWSLCAAHNEWWVMFHLFVGSVNDLNSTWNILLPLQLFIVYLYQCELMGVYSIIWVTAQFYFILLCKIKLFAVENFQSFLITHWYTYIHTYILKEVMQRMWPLTGPRQLEAPHHSPSLECNFCASLSQLESFQEPSL